MKKTIKEVKKIRDRKASSSDGVGDVMFKMMNHAASAARAEVGSVEKKRRKVKRLNKTDPIIRLDEVGRLKRFAVTAVEYGDSVDGKGSVIGVYSHRDTAVFEMHQDAKQYYRNGGFDRIELKPDGASVGSTDECGCEWKVQEIEIQVYKGDLKNLKK